MEDDNLQRNVFSTVSQNQMNDPTFIKLKLDTSPLLGRTERFLSGKETFVIKGEDGQFYEKERVVGKPFANEQGVVAILNILDLTANNHTVQGNFKEDNYYNFMADTRIELTKNIVVNCHEWDIEDSKIEVIIDTLMRFIRAFSSRLIDNKERESLSTQFMSREVINQGKKQGVLQNFAGGVKGA